MRWSRYHCEVLQLLAKKSRGEMWNSMSIDWFRIRLIRWEWNVEEETKQKTSTFLLLNQFSCYEEVSLLLLDVIQGKNQSPIIAQSSSPACDTLDTAIFVPKTRENKKERKKNEEEGGGVNEACVTGEEREKNCLWIIRTVLHVS